MSYREEDIEFQDSKEFYRIYKNIHKEYEPEKVCVNCKHYRLGPAAKSKGVCKMFDFCHETEPLAPVYKCIYGGRKYWCPDGKTAFMTEEEKERQKRIEERHQIDVCHNCEYNWFGELGLGCKRTENTFDAIVCRTSGNIFYKAKNKTEDQKFCQSVKEEKVTISSHNFESIPDSRIGNASNKVESTQPENKYTIYDLYDLVFPDDPIRDYFIKLNHEIQNRYQPQENVLKKLEAQKSEKSSVTPIPFVTYDGDSIKIVLITIGIIMSFYMVVAFLYQLF